jgi:uncharacterized protein
MAFTLSLVALGLAFAPMPAEQSAPVKAGVEAWERGEFARAVEMWRGPAIGGDADAQFNLGQAYKLGRGVAVDLKQAEDWYRRAAQQGHARAQDNYGLILYQNGKRREAISQLATSADRGEPRAQYVYGTELFNGELVSKDWVRAYAMMTRASAAGIPRASENLAQMDAYIPAAQRQQGIELARTLERQKPAAPAELVDAPAPKLAATGPGATYPVPGSAPPATPIAAAPKAAPPKVTPAKPSAAPTGKWRVQLGAFSEAGRAQRLWETLSRKVSALSDRQPYLVRSGAVTRLQAGGYASQSAATSACSAVKAAGVSCLVVKP